MICNLCKSEKELCNSHIIPEFLFKPLYDPKHRAIKLLADKSKRFIQKGLRDSLLCRDCEQHIANNIETPFAEQWWKILPSSHSNPLLTLSGLDYKITRLMILTNLWRAHCSQKSEWEPVKLDRYASEIAQMIQNIDPGDEAEFPIWGQLIVDEVDRVRSDIITPFAQWHPGG